MRPSKPRLNAAGASGYTVRITSKSATSVGIALAEVYDEESIAAPVRLVNVSTSGFVGTGDKALVPGFFIGGQRTEAAADSRGGAGTQPVRRK
jgi:hypothetical protein